MINSRLYSIYLNDWQSTSGSILFGGIDNSKYHGPLQTLDILPDTITGGIDQFITTVTDMSVKVNGKTTRVWAHGSPGADAYKNDNPSLPVLLDTGSAAWSVPESYYPVIAQKFPYVDRHGLCPCSAVDSEDTITLTFGGKIDITIPASEFIVPIYNRTTTDPYETYSGKNQCAFMIVPSKGTGQGFDTLGDSILRSMYLVYDLDNGQMSLAQANVNSTASSDIKAVPAGPNGVRKVANNVKAAPVQSYPIAGTINANGQLPSQHSEDDCRCGHRRSQLSRRTQNQVLHRRSRALRCRFYYLLWTGAACGWLALRR